MQKKSQMNLEPGTKIGRYEIRSLLGAGGMGEVYRAFDTELEREAALKFLKPTDDEDKLRRFRQEAKAVSALSHPNILTIYEVGSYRGSHFIVSELINGQSLREVISERNLSFDEILEIGVQIGNALAAAHAVGIVHRDIKPENIMVLPDGNVKVLDFGLAKFVGLGKNLETDFDGSTASLIQTKAGMIIGTVNYMSPEQLRGKPIDALTDIWSLGIVLFETLTLRRPFTGESVSDVIASILEHPLPPLAQLDGKIPPEIARIVSKALQKNKAERYQSAKDFVTDVKKARFNAGKNNRVPADQDEFSSSFHLQKTLITKANPTVSVSTNDLSGLFIAGTKVRWQSAALAGFMLLSAISLAGWFFVYQPLLNQPTAKKITMARLTTTGNISNATISPDGNFIVYVQNNEGKQSLWLRQTNETSGTKLIAESPESYAGLTFKPDGNWIYYTIFTNNGAGKLRRIQLLGGAPMEIAKDVDSAISFAPDGKSYAFIRSNPREGINQIIIANVEANGERVLSERRRPEFYVKSSRESLSWSPDGKFIACPFGKIDPHGEFMSVVEINAETGEQKYLTETRWQRVGRVLWTSNADELLITAAETGSELFQIRKIFRSTGQTQNITGELSDYYNLSLNKDSTRLLAVVYEKNSKLYTASTDQPDSVKPLSGGNYDGLGGVSWSADGRIIYVSTESRNRDIWTINAAEGKPQQMTFEEAADDFPAASSDGKYVVFVSSRTGTPHLWRMNSSGGEPKQLTDQSGEEMPDITPDGKFVIYSRTGDRPLLWKVSIEGGEPSPLTKEQTYGSAISPDGKFIVCLTRGETLESPTLLALVSADGDILQTFKPSGILSAPGLSAAIRWLPDGQKFSYAAAAGDISNVWTQAVTGGEPKKITDFTADRIFSFDWSKDGKRVVYARGALRNDLVLIEKF